jgi:cation diffusion facilitator CzcD-associated flavoprotein CzcO
VTTRTALLVIGAGPYALSTAARARERGIGTVVVGRPMGFWREHMPAGMFLRSGIDWHLDASGTHTLAAFLEEGGVATDQVDPLPISVFLDYAEWFRTQKKIEPRRQVVTDLVERDGRFLAGLDSGELIVADAVVAAPGVRYFSQVPAWAGSVPPGRATHTCDLIRFDELAGARVVIVGGRQSAYEWAALLAEHDAERIDIVHRHAIPRFDRVSWRFVDSYVESTMQTSGWWRHLSTAEQDAISLRFWQAGRLTLEYWLAPRLAHPAIHRRPETEVIELRPAENDGRLRLRLSTGQHLVADHLIFATGYRVELGRVPYLGSVLDRISTRNGFPTLDDTFMSSLPGLYLPGFTATADFGPFFGFVKGAPAAATLIVNDLLTRA